MISASCDSPELQNLEESMPWTEITRLDYDRRGLRYASDTTDDEWALIKLFMPPRSKVGCPRRTNMRAIWDAIQYIAATGCQWAMLPRDFPPFTTVQYYFYLMRDSGVLDALNDALVGAARLRCGQENKGAQAAYRDRYRR
jgi:transposase